LLVLAVQVGCAGKQVMPLKASGNIDFSGSWELDAQTSDRVMEKIRWLYAAARIDAKRRQEAIANQRAPVAANTNSPWAGDIATIVGLGRLTEMITQATVLTISQTENQIIIERNDDFSLVCQFGSTHQVENRLGKEQCGWYGEQIVFEIQLPQGLRVVHLLTHARNAERLNLSTSVYASHSSQPFSLNRVYIPFEPVEEDMYDCEFTLANQTTCTLGETGK
jgi:hypothetical protein